MIAAERIKKGKKFLCQTNEEPFKKTEIFTVESFDGEIVTFADVDVSLTYSQGNFWKDNGRGVDKKVDFELISLLDDIKNDNVYRCTKPFGTFVPGQCYPVEEHDDFSVKLKGVGYRISGKEMEEFFEIADDKSRSKRLTWEIIELFEEILDKNDITVPDEDRTGDDGEARLYGMTYANLEDNIIAILSRYVD